MKRFGLFLLPFVFTSLACVALLGKPGQTTDQPSAGQAPVQPPVIQLPNLTGVQLGDEVRDEACGYSFRKVPIYGFDQTTGFGPEMRAPGADPTAGPSILLLCSVRDETEAETLEDMVKELTPESSGTPDPNAMTYSNRQNIQLGGVNAVSFDTAGTTSEGIAWKGRIVVAMITPSRRFGIIGAAPLDKWEETRPYFEAVQNSVSFFEPTITPTANP